jgi:hypothetical protein
MIYSGEKDRRTQEERRNDFDKDKQLKKHKASCQKAHSKRKSKKHK